MTSFFGEVRPLFSRAVDDEEVDILPNYRISTETFHGKSNHSAKLMIVSIGEIASIFVSSYFLHKDSNLICKINYSIDKHDDDSLLYTGIKTSKKLSAASVYELCPSVLVCDVSKFIPEEICFEVTDFIFKNYVSSEVVILTSKHMATFKGENPVHSKLPFIKSLCTTYYFDSYSCSIPRLNPPNFLTNMAASILLQCEIFKIPAVCFLNFLDSDAVDYLNVQTFDEILKETIVSQVPIDADVKAKVIKLVKAKQSTESNLYI